MRKIVILLSFMIGGLSIQAAKLKIVARDKVESIRVYRLTHGELEECAGLDNLAAGSEQVIGDLQPGVMHLLRMGMLSRYFYTGTEDLKMNVEYRRSIMFEGAKGINGALEEWYQLSEPVRCMSSEFYRDMKSGQDTSLFFTNYGELAQAGMRVSEMHKGQLTGEEFSVLQTVIRCETDYFLYCYLLSPLVSATFKSYPAMVKERVMNPALNEGEFLKYFPEAAAYLMCYMNVGRRCQVPGDKLLGLLKTDDLKAFYYLQEARRVKTHAQFLKVQEQGKPYFTSTVLRERLEAVGRGLAGLSVGQPGYDFSLPDVDGKLVRLSDLKGKVVLVDLWATWCGPCKRELPHLKKLKEQFKDQDVAVVGISVDKEEQKEKWKAMAKSIGGVQLLDSKNTVGGYYKCGAVPHFLLFDKEGRIVSLDAPRPSNSALKTLLEKQLRYGVK